MAPHPDAGESSLPAPASADDAPLPDPHEDQEIERLRSLLFNRELLLLDQLRARMTSPESRAEDVGSVLAEALILRAREDDRLKMAMEPLVDRIVKDALHDNPHEFSESLFPLMGPSIRRSIAESFHAMLENFSKSMEMSFSWKGLRWRLESLRTGKPFSEIVLLHTLIYRVDAIYFIHSATGINLSHVVHEGAQSSDSDMVSAMLTAIQDFVNDCLVDGRKEDLDFLRQGEYSLLVERRPAAYLACVVRGEPPPDFRGQMRSCLEYLVMEYAKPLAHFKGDTSTFAAARPRLEKLLSSRFADEDKPLPFWTKALLAGLLAACVSAAGYGVYRHRANVARTAEAEERRLSFRADMLSSVDLLRREPGLLIIHVEDGAGTPWEIFCLKDSLAANPADMLKEHGRDASLFKFTQIPFISYDPDMVSRRVHASILPPENVSMRFEDGTVYLSGTAPMDWTLEARRKAMVLPGVKDVDIRDLSDPRTAKLAAMMREVEGAGVEFPAGKDTPVPEDLPKLTRLVDTLADMERLAAEMGMAVNLTIYGHADATGTVARNYEISQARAKVIAAMLYARGSGMPLALYGLGADYARRSDGPDQSSRRIELHVYLSPAAGPGLNFINP
ncbi:MAG: hypothetical protein LBQ51_06025 [Desulfovibrio sp.]|jgi:OOP family OmpA-OmpF porin|nr:hypothetical protein [Desulfovibrio sp.]